MSSWMDPTGVPRETRFTVRAVLRRNARGPCEATRSALSEGEVVEAAGIEPASESRPTDASTCVVSACFRVGQEQRRPKHTLARRDLAPGYGRAALGSQSPHYIRAPIGDVMDGCR